jgi:UDP-glucose 4-epimerase
MKKVLITGKNSYVGTNIEDWLKRTPDVFEVDTVDTFRDHWKQADFSKYNVVFHVAGITHVNAKKSMEPLFRQVNTDLTIEIAKWAKRCGVHQFIFMSSMIVYHESRSLKKCILMRSTKPSPNGFYGDSKLQAEIGLTALEDDFFKVCILRPPMIYGPNCKGNFLRLAKPATITPIFPAFHNQRSMLYIINLAEFVRYCILLELSGTYFPQNKEYADTVEIVKFFAEYNNHKLYVWRWLNIFVYIGSLFLNSLNKMFSTYCYEHEMSKYEFDYQLVSQQDSFKSISIKDIESMKAK